MNTGFVKMKNRMGMDKLGKHALGEFTFLSTLL
jgi:hypothetical protein